MKKNSLVLFLILLSYATKAQVLNKSINFTGTATSKAGFTDINQLDNVSQFSFEAWVYINNWSENGYIFSKYATVNERIDLQLGPVATKRLYFHVSKAGN